MKPFASSKNFIDREQSLIVSPFIIWRTGVSVTSTQKFKKISVFVIDKNGKAIAVLLNIYDSGAAYNSAEDGGFHAREQQFS